MDQSSIGKRIKRVRKARGLAQKEVISAIGMDPAQYSRIENGKTEPYIGTVERIAKALGVSIGELLNEQATPTVVHTVDMTLMERVRLIGSLPQKEQETIFAILDAFVGKKRLKEALESALQEAD